MFVTNIQNILTTFDSKLIDFVLLRLSFKNNLFNLIKTDLTKESLKNDKVNSFLKEQFESLKKKYSDFLKSNNLEDEETITHLEDFINNFKKIDY